MLFPRIVYAKGEDADTTDGYATYENIIVIDTDAGALTLNNQGRQGFAQER